MSRIAANRICKALYHSKPYLKFNPTRTGIKYLQSTQEASLPDTSQRIPANFYQQCRLSSSSVLEQLLQYQFTDYDTVKKIYHPIVPNYFNFARDFVDDWAKMDIKNQNDFLAMWFVYTDGRELKWTYPQISELSQKAANALAKTGAGKEWKRCMLLLPKVPDWWLITLANTRLGTVMVHGTTMLTAKDIEYRLQVSKADCIITNEVVAAIVDEVAPRCPTVNTKVLVASDQSNRSGWHNYNQLFTEAAATHKCESTLADDPAHLFFTSGTTSMPKLVVHTNGGLGIGHYYLARYVLNLDRGQIFWNIADPGWAKTAWSSFFAPWCIGATVFIHQMPQFDPALVLELLQKYPVYAFCAPPTVYRMLVGCPLPKLPHLKFSFSAGEPLNAEVIRVWKENFGLDLREGYGQTETPALCSNYPTHTIKPGSMGRAVPHLHVAIVDDEGKELPPNTEGHIALKIKPDRPIGLFKEYEDEPEKTASTVIGDFYITGDRGYMDKDGYFWFVSRTDDVINSAAYRIGPFEVESALQEHPDVLESAVVASPDPVRGEIVKAFVVLNPEARQKDKLMLIKTLQDHVKTVTAPYKYPRKIEFVDSLPKTLSGKIKRAELRKMEWNKSGMMPLT